MRCLVLYVTLVVGRNRYMVLITVPCNPAYQSSFRRPDAHAVLAMISGLCRGARCLIGGHLEAIIALRCARSVAKKLAVIGMGSHGHMLTTFLLSCTVVILHQAKVLWPYASTGRIRSCKASKA